MIKTLEKTAIDPDSERASFFQPNRGSGQTKITLKAALQNPDVTYDLLREILTSFRRVGESEVVENQIKYHGYLGETKMADG